MPFSAVLAAALQPLVGGEQIQRRKHCIILFVYIPCGKRKSCPMLFIYICYGVFPLSIYSLNRLRKGGQRICLMVSVSISVGVAAISVMNICVSVNRKPTPPSKKSTKKNGDFTSVFWHREKSPFGQQKSPIDSGFSQETSFSSPHSGGVGETRTLAPGFSRPTPLAGAPRHQLEYNSIGTSCQGVQLNLGGGESGIRTHGPLRDHWFSRPAP